MRPALAAACLLSAACAAPAGADPLPFEGRWDCEVGEFTFTATSYDAGEGAMEILDVAEAEGVYVLTLADDYQIALTMDPGGTMEWFSAVSGDSFTCRPLP